MQTNQQSNQQVARGEQRDTHNYDNYSPFNGIMAAFCSVLGLAAAGGAAFGLLKWLPTPELKSSTEDGDIITEVTTSAKGLDTQDYILIAAIGAMILAATACVVHHYALQDKEAREDREARARFNKYETLPNPEVNITYDTATSEEVGKTIVSTVRNVQEIISNANKTKDKKQTEQTDPLENIMTV